MATSGTLIDLIARVLKMPRNDVRYIWLQLQAQGLVTKGGRGRSASHVTARDAATFLIACIASLSKLDAVKAFAAFAGVTADHTARRLFKPTRKPGHMAGGWEPEDFDGKWHFDGFKVPELQALPKHHRFIDAVTAILEAVLSGSLLSPDKPVATGIDIYVFGPVPRGGIEIDFTDMANDKPKFRYVEEAAYQATERADENDDFESRHKISARTIREVADLLKN